jgi:uncharacterized membrane protein YccF (DUF307 family)
VLNVIWLVLAGFWMAVGYVAAGILCCILIITIPFGIACFSIASFKLVPIPVLPLGREIVPTESLYAGPNPPLPGYGRPAAGYPERR